MQHRAEALALALHILLNVDVPVRVRLRRRDEHVAENEAVARVALDHRLAVHAHHLRLTATRRTYVGGDLSGVVDLLNHAVQVLVLLALRQMAHDQRAALRVQCDVLALLLVLQAPALAAALRDGHTDLPTQHLDAVHLHRRARRVLYASAGRRMQTRASELDIGGAVELLALVQLEIHTVHVADRLEELRVSARRRRYVDDVTARERGVEVADIDGGRLDLGRRLLLHGGPVLLRLAALHLHGEAAAVTGLVLGAHLLAIEEQRARAVFLRAHLDVPHSLGATRVAVANQLD